MKRLILSLLTVALLPMTVEAQTNATNITSGGYYRLYSPAKTKTLYADATNNGVSVNQPVSGDNTEVYQLTGSSDNYTILSVGANKYLNGFTNGNKFSISNKNWVTLSETTQTFQVKKNTSARADADKARWIIGYASAAITDDNWFNTNVNNSGQGGILRWKVDAGNSDDVASYFELYPCTEYTLNVTFNDGLSNAGETTISAAYLGYTSTALIATGNKLYVDATSGFSTTHLSISNAMYTASYSISSTTINVTIGLADKSTVISAAHGDATSLLTNASCESATGWTNGAIKASQLHWSGSNKTVFEPSATENNVVSQTMTNMPTGTYTVQVAVRGKVDDYVKLFLNNNSEPVATATLSGGNGQHGTIGKDGLVTAQRVDGPTDNGGWDLLQGTVTLASEGNLEIGVGLHQSGQGHWWQMADVKVLLNADDNNDATYTFKTKASGTYTDISSINKHFYTIGKNALVTNTTNTSSLPNVIVGGTCAKLKLTDGAYNFGTTEAFTATSVTYDRTFTASNASTVCLPFALNATETASLGTFYTLDSYSDNKLRFVETTTTEAYKPYLVVPTGTGITISGSKTIDATPGELTSAGAGASFVGTMTRQTGLKSDDSNTLYGYSSDGTFKKVSTTNAAQINPFRAYISIPVPPSSAPAMLSISLGGTTGIENAVKSEEKKDKSYYDLQGRRVQQPTKGLYIVNGKKVIIK